MVHLGPARAREIGKTTCDGSACSRWQAVRDDKVMLDDDHPLLLHQICDTPPFPRLYVLGMGASPRQSRVLLSFENTACHVVWSCLLDSRAHLCSLWLLFFVPTCRLRLKFDRSFGTCVCFACLASFPKALPVSNGGS